MKNLKDKEIEIKNIKDASMFDILDKLHQLKDFAIQSSISAIGFADLEGRLIYANNCFLRLWGYSTQEEIIGRHISEFAASKEQAKDVVSTLQAGKGYVGEGYSVRKDGTVFFSQMSANLVTAPDGKPVCMMASFIDMSERKIAEEKVLKSQIQFRSLFENMLEGYAYCRMLFENGKPVDFIYLEVNKKFEELTGLKNVTGKKASEAIQGILKSDSELIKTYGRVALTQIPEKFEVFLESLQMWFIISVYCPEKEYFVAVFDVITERKKSENKLKDTQLLLKAGIESPKDMIILAIDKDYNYLFFNHVHKNAMILAYGKEVEVGMNILDCITSDIDKANSKVNYDRALNGESHSTIQEYGDKERSYYETFYNPIINESNKIIGATAYSRDITERIRSESIIKENEHRYRTLFNNMSVGFGLHEVIYDKEGNAVDYRFLDVNPAFETITGLKASNIIGKTVKEVLPLTEQYWIDIYSKVVQTGDNYTFQNYAKEFKKWFEVRTFKAEEKRFGTIFSDITEQKQSFLRLQKIMEGTMKAFSSIVEVQDPYTSGHQERVAKLSLAIGKELNLDEKNLNALNTAALLHDLGKIAIPSSILSKPSKLTDIEFEMIKYNIPGMLSSRNSIKYCHAP